MNRQSELVDDLDIAELNMYAATDPKAKRAFAILAGLIRSLLYEEEK